MKAPLFFYVLVVVFLLASCVPPPISDEDFCAAQSETVPAAKTPELHQDFEWWVTTCDAGRTWARRRYDCDQEEWERIIRLTEPNQSRMTLLLQSCAGKG